LDVRLLIPRTRRALQGPTGSGAVTLQDSQVRDLVADAIASVMWYAPEWGKVLAVKEKDSNDIPIEYEITPDLTLPEQTVVAAQAALDFFFHEFKDKKTSETIANEAQQWSYQLSAGVLQAQFNALVEARDRALDMIGGGGATFVAFSSFLHARDCEIAAAIEPFTLEAASVGGMEHDWRFE
jgi:hypothetical protein